MYEITGDLKAATEMMNAICNADKDGFVDLPMVDLKAEHVKKGGSGVESFNCDDRECVLEKDRIRKLSGLKSMEDHVRDMINKLVNDFYFELGRIKRAEKKEKLREEQIQALLLAIEEQELEKGNLERNPKLNSLLQEIGTSDARYIESLKADLKDRKEAIEALLFKLGHYNIRWDYEEDLGIQKKITVKLRARDSQQKIVNSWGSGEEWEWNW